MKKLFLAVCLILALPLLFSGQRQSGNFANAVAQGCADMGSIGNCAQYEPNHHRGLGASHPKNSGSTESPVSTGIGVISLLLVVWAAMRL